MELHLEFGLLANIRLELVDSSLGFWSKIIIDTQERVLWSWLWPASLKKSGATTLSTMTCSIKTLGIFFILTLSIMIFDLIYVIQFLLWQISFC
jgi:hypothetical protein